MVSNRVYLDDGFKREGKTRYRTAGTAPTADTIEAYDGESLASITSRAYGANTPENRERIRAANASLKGTLNVPR